MALSCWSLRSKNQALRLYADCNVLFLLLLSYDETPTNTFKISNDIEIHWNKENKTITTREKLKSVTERKRNETKTERYGVVDEQFFFFMFGWRIYRNCISFQSSV